MLIRRTSRGATTASRTMASAWLRSTTASTSTAIQTRCASRAASSSRRASCLCHRYLAYLEQAICSQCSVENHVVLASELGRPPRELGVTIRDGGCAHMLASTLRDEVVRFAESACGKVRDVRLTQALRHALRTHEFALAHKIHIIQLRAHLGCTLCSASWQCARSCRPDEA